ncbi:uncharacterized protein TRAVEDRAFT_71098 [Trametes versicolor FP-101664 SS1]|uniref:uncharacterized protein n=1 Tax=Trametes versicolor (strain FP-101664) TaxID=717944 RepID=UPI0004622005|nr:uncharacterized protein TRAVEDRAFT_71098 [Trametes versicolor FP-101664 SS1]EIW60824.1 hypothetical protein TRAVEDRAFT_71098 [Trametes versicolor FP-101664 SS1]
MEKIKPIVTYYRGRKPVENTKGKQPTGRNVSKLMGVMKLPLDVFFEIASHLHPLDVLQLSRVSNELRSMLLSRHSRHIWIAARKNIEPPFPDIEMAISEPKLAHLLFEQVCSACGSGRAQFADYAIAVRFCAICSKNNIKKGTTLAKELDIPKGRFLELVNLLPSAHGPRAIIRDWQPSAELSQQPSSVFYKPELVIIAGRFDQLRASKDEQALQRFIEEQKTSALQRFNFHMAVLIWETEARSAKATGDEAARSERHADIIAKLVELGYQSSEIPAYDHAFQRLLDQPRKLTPRIWNTIRPKLVEMLEERRRAREQDAFKKKWRNRLSQLKVLYDAFLQKDRNIDLRKRTLPGWGDAVQLDCMQSLLTAQEPQADIVPDKFAAIQEDIFSQGEEFGTRARDELACLLREEESVASQPPSTTTKRSAKGKGKKIPSAADNAVAVDADALLNRPTALFRCVLEWNPHGFSWAGLLEHWQQEHAHASFAVKPFAVCDSAASMKRLLEALGLPDTARLSEVENLAASGEPVCTCSVGLQNQRFSALTPKPTAKHCYRVYRLMRHVENPPCQGSDKTVHHITFVPFTDEASSWW